MWAKLPRNDLSSTKLANFSPFFGSFWPFPPLFLHFAAGQITREGCSYSLVTYLIPHCNRNADGKLDSLKIASMVTNLAIFATLGPFFPHFPPFTPILQPPTVLDKIPAIIWARPRSICARERPPASVIPAKLPD